jgi:hypothetical protein
MSSTRLRGRFQEVDVVHRQFGIMHENVIGGCNGLVARRLMYRESE